MVYECRDCGENVASTHKYIYYTHESDHKHSLLIPNASVNVCRGWCIRRYFVFTRNLHWEEEKKKSLEHRSEILHAEYQIYKARESAKNEEKNCWKSVSLW
jgi:hypothetical protein